MPGIEPGQMEPQSTGLTVIVHRLVCLNSLNSYLFLSTSLY